MNIPSEFLPQSIPDEIMPSDAEIAAMVKDVDKLIADNFHMSFEEFATRTLLQQIKEADDAAERRFKEFFSEINLFGEAKPGKAILQDVISDYASASVEVRGRCRDYKSALDFAGTAVITRRRFVPSFGGRTRPPEKDRPPVVRPKDNARAIRKVRARAKVKLLGGICHFNFTINTLNLILPEGKKIDSSLNGVAEQIAETLPPLFSAKLKEVYKSMLSDNVKELYNEVMQSKGEQLNRIETKVNELHKAAHVRGGRPSGRKALYSQKTFAEMIEVDETTVARWDKGQGTPRGYSRELRERGDPVEIAKFIEGYKASRHVKDALNTKHVKHNISEEQMHRESLK